MDKNELLEAYYAMVLKGPRNSSIEELISSTKDNEWIISVRILALHILIVEETNRRIKEHTDDKHLWILDKAIKLLGDQTEEDDTLGDPLTIAKRALLAAQKMALRRFH